MDMKRMPQKGRCARACYALVLVVGVAACDDVAGDASQDVAIDGGDDGDMAGEADACLDEACLPPPPALGEVIPVYLRRPPSKS
jgi:hypothetical protein